ncbi:MAG: ATP-dependent DNA helicase RecG [Thermodesulfobacteriota bacterium]
MNTETSSSTLLHEISKPLLEVKGIGPALFEKYKKKGLATIEDMLYFLPIRYEDRRNLQKISQLEPGTSGVTYGEVLATGETRYGRRKVFEVAISDGSSILMAKWFHFRGDYMKKLYTQGRTVFLHGSVSIYRGKKEMIHPEVEFATGEEDAAEGVTPAMGIVPVYSQVENLYPQTVRRHVKLVVEKFAEFAPPCAPAEVSKRLELMPLSDALMEAHAVGRSEADTDAGSAARLARRSIVFDELFSLELGLGIRRRNIMRESGIAFDTTGEGTLYSKLLTMLPFSLTGAQERVIAEIREDMQRPHPMNRLIQGDVGSGKTVVSFAAVLYAVQSGYQAAIMAPTELLAEQHYLTIKKYTDELQVDTMLLTGRHTKKEREAALARIKSGEAQIVIGTHALIQKDVEFARLGVAVVDEQHRFGVMQRGAFKKMSESGVPPDTLVMTATPIPRTLAMTIFGDMEVSIIDELPPGRTPVETKIVREKEREKAYKIIRDEVSAGGQAYIVYPLVEESEELPLKDATKMEEHLRRDIFPEFRLALLHGRMKSVEKEAVMRAFKDREIDILVATTVVEVGVDVANASVMMVEHAERFGLAQLHQLRGRVGRGERRSVCILLAQWTNSEDSLQRLRVMEQTMDGFVIAEEDLKIRGPGDFIGTRQSGLPDFRLKETLSDLSLLKTAREEAAEFLDSGGFEGPEGARVTEVLKARWADRLELAEVG